MTDLLQQGIAAARAGKREQARALLMQVVEADERNEQAWLWLAGVVDAPEDIRTCLQNVLDLNPTNQQAQQGLAWVEQRYGPAAPVSDPPLAAPEPTAMDTFARAFETSCAVVRIANGSGYVRVPEIATFVAPSPAPASIGFACRHHRPAIIMTYNVWAKGSAVRRTATNRCRIRGRGPPVPA